MVFSKEEKEKIYQALISEEGGGYNPKTANNIKNGFQKMAYLETAMKMAKSPFYISVDVWDDLYKQKDHGKKSGV